MTTQAHPSDAAPGERRAVLRVLVLGEPALLVDGHPAAYPAGRPGRLLASLVLARGRAVGADRLADDVWGAAPPGDVRAALHTSVARVRRALGPCAELLERTPSGYRLDAERLRVDADEFLELLTDAGGVERYDAALALWRGRAWGDLADDLAHGEALRLEEARLVAREERAHALLDAGRTAEALGTLRELVAEQPLRERGVALLMTGLHQVGDVAEALAAYAAHRDLLAGELGLDPSASLVELHGEILRREPATRPVTAVPDLSAARGLPPLLGRTADLAALGDLLALHRCVTLVGPGGVGKTTLAAHAVAERSHWWVDLASLTEAVDVLPAAAEVLGVDVFPGASVTQALRHRVATASGTVVLDNCEHLLGAAGDLTDELLAAGPGLRVLATSRERLGGPTEHVYPLPPLRLPGPDGTADDSPAVALFLERARALAPDLDDGPATLAAVADVVRRLDGLPLAIELAAGRVGTISLDDLREHLSERLDLLRSSSPRTHRRQRTLASTIAWSYDLLDERERSAFLRLSVFAGRFDLAAAEAVLGPDGADLVADLTERSLLVRPAARGRGEYRMLETLRAFAAERLEPDEDHAVRLAHAHWVADLVAHAAKGLAGPDEPLCGRRLDEALPDVAAAVHWTVRAPHPALAARIVGSLHRWAYFRLRPDVLRWSLDVLALDPLVPTDHGAADRQAVAALHVCAAAYHWMLDDHVACRLHGARALTLAESRSALHARALDQLSDLALAVGDLEESMRCSQEGYEIATAAGLWADATAAACGMVLAAAYAGDPATHLLAVAHRSAARARNPSWSAFVHYCEAEVLAESEPTRALEALGEAVRLADAVDNRLVLGISLTVDTAVRGRAGALDAETVDRSCRAVEYWAASGNEHLFLTCLRNLVPLLGRFGAERQLVELVAATSGVDAAYGAEAVRIDTGLRRARAHLGEEEYAAAWAAGAARGPVEAGRELLRVLPGLVGQD